MSDINGNSCANCLNYQCNEDKKGLSCSLDAKSERECRHSFYNDPFSYSEWKKDDSLTLNKYACLKSQEIFGRLKAKMFNVLEAQLPPEPNERRLHAAKSITEDIISQITNDVREAIFGTAALGGNHTSTAGTSTTKTCYGVSIDPKDGVIVK